MPELEPEAVVEVRAHPGQVVLEPNAGLLHGRAVAHARDLQQVGVAERAGTQDDLAPGVQRFERAIPARHVHADGTLAVEQQPERPRAHPRLDARIGRQGRSPGRFVAVR
jgi:hypothetical protein